MNQDHPLIVSLNREKILTPFCDKVDYGFFIDKMLVDVVKKENGTFFTFIEKELSEDKLYDLEQGGIFPGDKIKQYKRDNKIFSPVPNLDEYMTRFIVECSNQIPYSYCLFEDPAPSFEGDICSKVIEINGEVYHYVEKDNNSNACIEKIVDEVLVSWHFTVVVGELNNTSETIYTPQSISTNVLRQGVRFIIIGAYDGEGFVVWERSK